MINNKLEFYIHQSFTLSPIFSVFRKVSFSFISWLCWGIGSKDHTCTNSMHSMASRSLRLPCFMSPVLPPASSSGPAPVHWPISGAGERWQFPSPSSTHSAVSQSSHQTSGGCLLVAFLVESPPPCCSQLSSRGTCMNTPRDMASPRSGLELLFPLRPSGME